MLSDCSHSSGSSAPQPWMIEAQVEELRMPLSLCESSGETTADLYGAFWKSPAAIVT